MGHGAESLGMPFCGSRSNQRSSEPYPKSWRELGGFARICCLTSPGSSWWSTIYRNRSDVSLASYINRNRSLREYTRTYGSREAYGVLCARTMS